MDFIIYKAVSIGTSKLQKPEFKGIYMSRMIEEMGLTTFLVKHPVCVYVVCSAESYTRVASR